MNRFFLVFIGEELNWNVHADRIGFSFFILHNTKVYHGIFSECVCVGLILLQKTVRWHKNHGHAYIYLLHFNPSLASSGPAADRPTN